MKFLELPLNIQNKVLFTLSEKLENQACREESNRVNLNFDIWKAREIENWLYKNQKLNLNITDWLLKATEADLSI